MNRTSSVCMKAYCCSHAQMLPQCVMITVKVWRRSVSPHSFTVFVPRRPDSIYARVCVLHVCSTHVRVSTHLSTRVHVSTHVSTHAYHPNFGNRHVPISSTPWLRKIGWGVPPGWLDMHGARNRTCNLPRPKVSLWRPLDRYATLASARSTDVVPK